MNFKIFGGVLIIIGTTIGAGILALPLATAAGGFWYSVVLLAFCWLASTFSAFLLLEVNLWLPEKSNLISMAKLTLGLPGQVLAWFFYLLLLYSLTSAYVSGGSDVLHGLLAEIGAHIPMWLSSILFTVVLGYVVYLGVQRVDHVNRVFMSVKLITFALLVLFIFPFVDGSLLPANHFKLALGATTVAITSFGYSIVVPSLRSYFNSNIKQLRVTLLLGSLIPLVLYIIWEVAIFGIVPTHSPHGLIAIGQSHGTTMHLLAAIRRAVQSPEVITMARLFTAICMVTSFLGVSLSLKDFLFDGFDVAATLSGKSLVYGFTFLPALIIVIFMPSIFIIAIRYAGVACIVLLIIMPLLMAYRGRYYLGQSGYRVLPRGGKPLMVFFMIVGVILLALGWV